MNDQKENNQSNDKIKLHQIHTSLLKLYSYLKMDKIQIVSEINKIIIIIL